MNLPPQPYHTQLLDAPHHPNTDTTNGTEPATMRAPKPRTNTPLALIETSTASHHTSPVPFTKPSTAHPPATVPPHPHLKHKPIGGGSQKDTAHAVATNTEQETRP